MYAYHCLTGSWLFMLMFMYMYGCINVSMSLSDKVIKDHSCGRIIAYEGEWHEEVPGHMSNQLWRADLKNLRSVSSSYELILCLCYGQAILRDTSAKWKQCGQWHDRISMDGEETLEARLLGCAYVVYVVHVAFVMLCACVVVYIYSVCTCCLCNVMYRVV